jgi:hypothetical protein
VRWAGIDRSVVHATFKLISFAARAESLGRKFVLSGNVSSD